MNPTPAQLDARLNPQAFNINIPGEGQVFRAVGDNTNSTLYTIKNGVITNIAAPSYVAQTKFSTGGATYNSGDILGFNPRDVQWLDPNYRGGAVSTISAGEVYDKQNSAGAYSALPTFNMGDIQNLSPDKFLAQPSTKTLNDTPNALATPDQLTMAQTATNNQLNLDPNRVINQTTGETAGQAKFLSSQQGIPNQPVMTPAQQNAYYASQGNSPTPLTPAQWLAQQGTPSATGTPATGTPPVQPTQPVNTYTGPSIVDYLASIGKPSDFASRSQLANSMGIQNYTGSAAQNTQLLDTLRKATPSLGVGGTSVAGTSTGTPSATGTPQTSATTTTPAPQTPQSFIDTYKQALGASGVNSIKTEFDKVQTEYTDLQNKLNDEISAVNENPWISEGLRSKKITALQSKYDGKLSILTNKLKLYDSLHQQAQIEAKFLAQGIQNQQQFDENTQLKLADLAQKQSEALAKLNEQNIHQMSVNGREVLVDFKTQKIVADLGASKTITSSGSSGTPIFSNTQNNNGASNAGLSVQDFNQLPATVQNLFVNDKDVGQLIVDDIASVNSGSMKREDAISDINLQTIPQEAKDYFIGLVPQIKGTTSGQTTGTGVTGLIPQAWNWLTLHLGL